MDKQRTHLRGGPPRHGRLRAGPAARRGGVSQRRDTRRKAHLDLTDQDAVNLFFEEEQIDVVLLAAARVGGILANSTLPAAFIYENLAIETNVIHAACRCNVAQAGVLRFVVHLSEGMSAADPEEYLLTSRARADQRSLRDREDRGPQAVRGLQPRVRHAISCR